VRRRTFLKWAGGTTAALAAAGGGVWVLLFGERRAAPGRALLSSSEMHVARAVAEALFPPGTGLALDARGAHLAERVDGYLAGLPAREQRYVRAGLRALEYASVPMHGSRFSRLSLGDRIAALRAEAASDGYLRHTAALGIKGIFGLVYFEIDSVRAELGWSLGCAPSGPR